MQCGFNRWFVKPIPQPQVRRDAFDAYSEERIARLFSNAGSSEEKSMLKIFPVEREQPH